MPQRVFITGGTGFLGSHLTYRLLRDGFETHLLIRPGSSPWRIQELQRRVVIWTGDLTDASSLKKSLQEAHPDLLVHLAWDTRVRHFKGNGVMTQSASGNFTGTLNLLEAVSETGIPLKRVILTGGLEEYGNGPIPYQEGQRENPVSPYSASQVAATHYAQMAHRTAGLPVVILRPALVYGPAQSTDFFIPSLIKKCLAGENFEMTNGTQTRDLIFVDDVIEAFVRAMTASDLDGEILNISTGKEHAMSEVAEKIVQLTGRSISIRKNSDQRRRSEIFRLVANNEKAKRLLLWSPQTDLEEGLRKTIAWFQNR